MDLHNSVVVVTGAATGVGRALAREAARLGAQIVAADINDATETAELIRAAGGEAIAAICDVTNSTAIHGLVETTLKSFGHVNGVCANTGSNFGAGTIDTVDVSDMRKAFELNVLGVLNTVQSFLPELKRAAGARQPAFALVTGSEHALSAPSTAPAMISYTTTKHALVGFVSCARRDLAGTGVHISLLCPGWVRTEMLMGLAQKHPGVAQAMAKFGQDVDEVARLAFAGVQSDRPVIPTNPTSREDGMNAYGEILDAIKNLPASFN